MTIPKYEIHQGDCIEKMHQWAKEGRQFDLSIFSPPFASLYVYSEDERDMGNSKDVDDEFELHYDFFANALFPLIKSGRNVCVHLQQVVRRKGDHGHMGLYDIRGMVNRKMQDAGFILYGEIAIPKNPQAQSIRTKTHRLQFSQWEKDSMASVPALADWLQIYKKPGDNAVPVCPLDSKGMNRDVWIEWADMVWNSRDNALKIPSTLWFGINETRVLNNSGSVKSTIGEGHKPSTTKYANDERHMCPLQLDLIERAVLLWSNKGETIFSPFGGIGSEAVGALLHNRNAVITELNPNYVFEAERNCQGVVNKIKHNQNVLTLFDL